LHEQNGHGLCDAMQPKRAEIWKSFKVRFGMWTANVLMVRTRCCGCDPGEKLDEKDANESRWALLLIKMFQFVSSIIQTTTSFWWSIRAYLVILKVMNNDDSMLNRLADFEISRLVRERIDSHKTHPQNVRFISNNVYNFEGTNV
jgi:hypothetical protein